MAGVDDRDVEAIRRDASALEGLGIREIADHYETIVRGLDQPPIIMGHSFGGLVTQILLDRGLGSAGVGIAASPFRGMLGLPFSTVRVAMSGGLKNPFGKGKTVMLTPKQFHYAFTNTLDAPRPRRSTSACPSRARRGRSFRRRSRTSTRTLRSR